MNQTIATQTSRQIMDKTTIPDGKPSFRSAYATGPFWERLWRMSGLLFAGFFIITWVIYGYQPGVGASVDAP